MNILFSFLIIIGVAVSEGLSVVYYVSPTEPQSSCSGNSSCPPGQLCRTMDYIVENSSEFFSPEHINVTLIFMCGVHNYTKDLTVQNLHSFIMKGEAESKENVIIDMLSQVKNEAGTLKLNHPSCATIHLFNVSFVNITTLTMRCPSLNIDSGLITIRNANLFGYSGTTEILSYITVTDAGSQALLDNCTFAENCFIVSNKSSGVTMKNSTFQLYRHKTNSIIAASSSVITLIGYVNFTDSFVGLDSMSFSSGTAIYLTNAHAELKSSLNIAPGATVYFVNLTCNNCGGAIYGGANQIEIGANATVIFKNNMAKRRGGALCLWKQSSMNIGVASNVVFFNNTTHQLGGGAIFMQGPGHLNIDANAIVSFTHNVAYSHNGGAVYLIVGTWNISTNANVCFTHNSALALSGGAVYMQKTKLFINISSILFYNNSATVGGALYLEYANMHINSHGFVNFSTNFAGHQGGAVYITEVGDQSIIVNNSAKLLFHNNSATQGGALYIVPTSFTIELESESIIQFMNNTATDVGGAVYSELQSALPCMFLVMNDTAEISFIGNSANRHIGDHIYGTSIRNSKCDFTHISRSKAQGVPYCLYTYQKSINPVNMYFPPGLNETLSPVSSDPWRVCLCDSNGQPLCMDLSQVFVNISIYRGEEFKLSACVVGYNLGTTSGSVYAEFLNPDPHTQLKRPQYEQIINTNGKCSTLSYAVYTKSDENLLRLHTSRTSLYYLYSDKKTLSNRQAQYTQRLAKRLSDYSSNDRFGCLSEKFLTTPVFINVILLPGCPPGLTLRDDSTTCRCYSVLPSFSCFVQNKTGYITWLKNNTVWVNATFNESQSNGIIYNRFCPLNYCKSDNKTINIGDDPSKQCVSNRTGILCGACMENFSMAIGSSRCIECPNSHNVALLLAFAAAGVFLVFFILALNLTVTQGLINGLIFYANIVWAYKIILFPSEIQENYWLVFLQVFVAWLNLDFGIESCFFVGLDAYWKTWLQFLFPFYIWAIAGVIIVACRYSSRLTNLIASRAVPLLATLFLLSYMKLLRTIIDATSVAVIAQYPQNTSYVVWYLDGNLHYCQHPHIYLFLAAVATLVFLWLPYTLLLLFIQPLRRISHLRPLKWINKLAPVYDVYFSPLKDKHQYWFGTMFLVRGILLVILTVTSAANPVINVLILLLTISFLVITLSVKTVYKHMTVRVLESATLLNLIVLSAGTLYKWESTKSRSMLLIVSIGITFAQFCVIVVWNLIKPRFSAGWRCRQKQTDDVMIDKNINDDIIHERIEDPELEPLITHARRNYDEPKATY